MEMEKRYENNVHSSYEVWSVVQSDFEEESLLSTNATESRFVEVALW